MPVTVDLQRGDALHLLRELPDESVDAVITDPPYSSGGMHRSDRLNGTGAKYIQGGTVDRRPDFQGDARDQRGYLAWCSLWLSECLRIVKPGRPCLIFTDWRQLPTTTDAVQAAGFIWRGVVVWDKVNARPNLGFSSQCEYIVWGTRGPTDLGHEIYLPGLIRAGVERGDDKWHQTAKPVGLMEQLMAVVPEGGTVLDPFAGSATTLVAARNRGHNAIGMEIDSTYHGMAGKRLDQLSLGEVA